MGNKISFFVLHGKRLKNRYNAQYRALEFIGKENRPSAPRHPSPDGYTGAIQDDSVYQELQKKNLQLDEYLKNLYIYSPDQTPQDSHIKSDNPKRPLPESREPKSKPTFKEPEEVELGKCTITHVSDFLLAHQSNPTENDAAAIAEKYKLEEKKVENTLKYITIFKVVKKEKTQTKSYDNSYEQELREIKEGHKLAVEFRKSYEKLQGRRKTPTMKIESPEKNQPVDGAIKN